MRFVGYSEFYHDAAIGVVEEDGTVSYACQAERFSKVKNDPVIPDEMWDKIVRPDDHISFYEQPDLKFNVRGGATVTAFPVGVQPAPPLDLHAKGEIPMLGASAAHRHHLHHVSHCALAYFTRPWTSKEDTVMVSIDGAGELQSAVIMDHNFNLIKEILYPKSIGVVYSLATMHLGLKQNEDEYVVMGLSSYGQPKFADWLINWYNNHPDIPPELEQGLLIGDPRESATERDRVQFKRSFTRVMMQHRRRDIAASVQKFAEYAIMQLMREARKHGSKLVYSGGVAQNILANTLARDLFDDMHVAIAPADSGSGLGAAAKSWSEHTGGDRLIWTPYLGDSIDTDLNPAEIVDYLLEHKVCGVAHGRAEFGPRALGNRSLIADVRYDVKDTVNEIKRRQAYRPFAPAILEEHVDTYFDGYTNEYMQYTAKALHDYRSVTHIDGTARVQVLKKDCPSILRKIVEEYYERTGVPMVLNTSLNIRGRPMVNDKNDARLFELQYGVKVFS